MARKKLKKFSLVDKLPNVFCEIPEDRQSWVAEYFENENEVVLEVGCGRGDYSIRLAERFPNKNFIGVDVKGDRIWTGANTVLKQEIQNVAFLRASAKELTSYFGEHSIAEIWIPFPDPFPKKRGVRKRVTSPHFLEVYQSILKKAGKVHLKTDDLVFYERCYEIVKEMNLKVHVSSSNIYEDNGLDSSITEIRTKYEEMHLEEGRTIKYLCFSF